MSKFNEHMARHRMQRAPRFIGSTDKIEVWFDPRENLYTLSRNIRKRDREFSETFQVSKAEAARIASFLKQEGNWVP